MEKEFIYSRVEDKNIRKNIKGSPIWKECHHREELDDLAGYWEYLINFNGLEPVQVLKIQQF